MESIQQLYIKYAYSSLDQSDGPVNRLLVWLKKERKYEAEIPFFSTPIWVKLQKE